jgi:DNA replicative helicase MCM subunit Mcm2 (Cdc46/Mcm family)
MKFTKEQALESIKAKFVGKSGKTSQKISDITISDTIESLLSIEGVVTDETELDDFVTKAFRHVDTLNRNVIKEQSDFVKNYNPEPLRMLK